MATKNFDLKREEGWKQLTTGVETGTFQVQSGLVEITESATMPADNAPTQRHPVFTVTSPMVIWGKMHIISRSKGCRNIFVRN
ncbi:hypothetical protein [Limnobaculum xujianqingii]|uniref:hypothetical protein n=1 Tax=Limnobaculum xujianqingii TaxID=2738837 RepID=UPI001128E0E9|nr:hypothetical protein [Limnobaculum xujianqingii]